MSGRAQTTAIPALPTAKRKPPPKRVREAVRLLVEGNCRTIADAARKVGFTREHLSKSLTKNSWYMAERIQHHIAIGGARGAARMVELVNMAESEKIIFEAAKFLLGVAGVRAQEAASINVNIGLQAGYVIDLSEPGEPDIAGNRIVAGGEIAPLPPPPEKPSE
jgi:hypothetical protein